MMIRKLGKPSVPAAAGGRRMLVTVTVLGSAGPFRFVASEGETAAAVIGTTLRRYAQEGRLPVLACDATEFHLFCAQSDHVDPLDPAEPIGDHGGRNFTLCKKRLRQATFAVPRMATGTGAMDSAAQPQPQPQPHAAAVEKQERSGRVGGGVWKACFNKSLHPKIPSH